MTRRQGENHAGDAIAPQNAANDTLFRRFAPYARREEEALLAESFRRRGARGGLPPKYPRRVHHTQPKSNTDLGCVFSI